MVRTLLIHGMLVGVLAGLLVFGFARIFGEPWVERAIAFEAATEAQPHQHQHGAADAHAAEPPRISRPVQAGLGLFTGVMVYATAIGGLFALVFAAANARAAAVGPRAMAALLAGAGFISVYLVPNLTYPANPPAVGDAETIAQRTALYFTMLGVSVAAMVAAAIIRRRTERRYGSWNAALLAGALYLVVVVAAATALPAIHEVPEGFPADVLWNFRVSSIGMQALLWATLGLGFGFGAERAMEGRPAITRRVVSQH